MAKKTKYTTSKGKRKTIKPLTQKKASKAKKRGKK